MCILSDQSNPALQHNPHEQCRSRKSDRAADLYTRRDLTPPKLHNHQCFSAALYLFEGIPDICYAAEEMTTTMQFEDTWCRCIHLSRVIQVMMERRNYRYTRYYYTRQERSSVDPDNFCAGIGPRINYAFTASFNPPLVTLKPA